jgi:hypothetical protein
MTNCAKCDIIKKNKKMAHRSAAREETIMNRTLSINGMDLPISRTFEQALYSKQSLSFACPYKMGKSWLSRADIRLER